MAKIKNRLEDKLRNKPPEQRLIFVLLDGLSACAATSCMGYLEGLGEAGKIFAGKLQCELPALSRPLYYCLSTGLRPADSGLVHNKHWQAQAAQSCFSLARDQGRITAAAAFCWFSELFNSSPFVPEQSRITNDKALPLQHALFYSHDDYPDAQVFLDAEALLAAHQPHLLLIHSLGIDCAGHRHGHDSAKYRNAVRKADMLLAEHMPRWLELGYQVMITSDHGSSSDKMHNGSAAEEREVPVYLAGSAFDPRASQAPRQVEWCGTLCAALGLVHDKALCRAVLRA